MSVPKKAAVEDRDQLMLDLQSAVANADTSTEAVEACLDRIDTLPLIERTQFLKEALAGDEFIYPTVKKPEVGERILQTLSVLWAHLPELHKGRISQDDNVGEDQAEGDGKYFAYQFFLETLNTVLSWGAHASAWELWETVIRPVFKIPEAPPWGPLTGHALDALQIFFKHKAHHQLGAQYIGSLDVTLPEYQEGHVMSLLTSCITHQDKVQRKAFCALIKPQQRNAFHTLSREEQYALTVRVGTLIAETTMLGAISVNTQCVSAVHDAFPWMLASAGAAILEPLLQQRGIPVPENLASLTKTMHDIAPIQQSALRKQMSLSMYGKPYATLLAPTQWRTWGATQNAHVKEALLWMAAGRQPYAEIRNWCAWARHQQLPETWWQARPPAPGLLTCMAHTIFRRWGGGGPNELGESLLTMKAWADALEVAYPQARDALQYEMREALDSFLSVGAGCGAWGGPSHIPLGNTLTTEQQHALLELGKRAGETWWHTPLAVTLKEVQHREAWTRKAWEGTDAQLEPWAFTQEDFACTRSRPDGTYATRLDIVARAGTVLLAYQEQQILKEELEGGDREEVRKRRRRV